jgi:apolipoprotein N-acyltransferase
MKHILKCVLPAAASALLLAAAFPALDWGFLGFVALVPLLCVLRHASWCEGTATGLITGFVFFVCFLYYVGSWGTVPWIALALFQGAYFGLASGLIAALRRCRPGLLWPLGAGAVWTLMTYLRGNVGPLSLPFGELGHTQHAAHGLAQAASVVGALGLTFIVAVVNAAIAQLVVAVSAGRPEAAAQAARACVAVGAVLLVVMLAGIGRFHLGREDLKWESGFWIRAVAVQADRYAGREPEVGIGLEAAEEYLEWSISPEAAGASLIVWPETAVVADPDIDPRFGELVDKTIARTNAYLLFGHMRIGEADQIHNAASLRGPDGERLGEYHKVHLVIFGEYVPYRDRFPFLERFPVRGYDIAPGDGWLTLAGDHFRLGPLICFESLFPRMSREVVRQGADVIVIITSDAWAGQTAQVWQHGYISQFRAIEQGRYLVRAGTTGLTCIISPFGEIVAQVEPFTQGVAAADIVTLTERTIYGRLGDWPMLLICVVLTILAVVSARRGGPSPDPDAPIREE